MKLVPNWKRLWRTFSMQAMGWAAAGLAAWPTLPDDIKAQIDPKYATWALVALLVCGMVGRAIHQPKVHE